MIDDTDFGSVIIGQNVTHTFTISTISNDEVVNLTGTPLVAINGAAASDFVVVTQPYTSSITSNTNPTFEVRFTPSTTGIRGAIISIDTDQGMSYTFAVQGAGVAAPAFTSSAPPAGTYGMAYSHMFSASGYPNPTFSVSSSTLPPGMRLDSDSGVLSGTPTKSGTFHFTVTASNSVGSVDQLVTLVINQTQTGGYSLHLPLMVNP